MTEDEMIGWHHQLDGYGFEQTSGDSEAWHAAVHRVAKSQTQLSDQTTNYCTVFHLEVERLDNS